jgi:aconitate hydratase
MGVLPLEFLDGDSAVSLALTGQEVFDVAGVGPTILPRSKVRVRAQRPDSTVAEFDVRVRIDTPEELSAYRHGGILPYVARRLAAR